MLTRGGICVSPTVTYLPYRVSGSRLTAVGRSQLLARWPGTHSRILSGFQRAAQTVLGVYLKRTCSRVTSAPSALGVLTSMRYTNPRTHSLTLRHGCYPHWVLLLAQYSSVISGSCFLRGPASPEKMLAAAAAGGGAMLWVRRNARWLAVAVVSLSCCMPVPLYLALSLSLRLALQSDLSRCQWRVNNISPTLRCAELRHFAAGSDSAAINGRSLYES